MAPPSRASSQQSQHRLSIAPAAIKPRQLSHLNAQLAQLQAHVADLESLVRMTGVQAEFVRGLGGYVGGMFMAASKVLGEETVAGAGMAATAAQSDVRDVATSSTSVPPDKVNESSTTSGGNNVSGSMAI
ncbi:MAG: hypothetical protein M1825_002576 [Sarcosagium campestre]|nr:MAG: hypothetical protein M1825_002576 [Sarcosagium campestre]